MIVNVFLVDDHQMFIDGMISIFENEEEIKVVGHALNGLEALKKIAPINKEIDVVITDINMPEMNGIEFIIKLKSAYPSLKVVCLSMYQDIDYVERIIYAGANSYLVKNTDKDTLINVIKKISQGSDTIYSEEIQKAIVKNHMDTKIPDIKGKYKSTEVEFTKRERQIIDLIFQGLTNNEIASKLDLSYHTITTHRKNIYIKMGVNSFREFSDFVKMHNIQIK